MFVAGSAAPVGAIVRLKSGGAASGSNSGSNSNSSSGSSGSGPAPMDTSAEDAKKDELATVRIVRIDDKIARVHW